MNEQSPIQTDPGTNACEFCVEFSGSKDTTFRRLYPNFDGGRVVRARGEVMVLPSISPITFGHVMIVPSIHVSSFADLTDSVLADAEFLLDETERSLEPLGKCFVYEHAVRVPGHSACGIDHAHLHVVPIPAGAHIPTFGEQVAKKLFDVLRDPHTLEFTAYLVSKNANDVHLVATQDTPITDTRLSSQFVRRVFSQALVDPSIADWRAARRNDPKLLRALQLFAVDA